jgi:hypothetical protein
MDKIVEYHGSSYGMYGASRTHADLCERHRVSTSRKRVAWLMDAAGLGGERRCKGRTTIADKQSFAAPDGVRPKLSPALRHRTGALRTLHNIPTVES